MDTRTIDLHDCIPVCLAADGWLLARDGSVTLGWELTPPEELTLTQADYDAATERLAAAFRGLPAWTMVHRQDVYRRRRFSMPPEGGLLGRCHAAHFEGRPYLGHSQYLFLTFNPAIPGRAGAMKGALRGASGGIRYRPPEMRGLPGRLRAFEESASEFVSVLCSGGTTSSRRLTREDFEGTPGGEPGLLEEHLRWFGGEDSMTDISLTGGTFLDRDSRRMLSHSFSRADDLPGEVSNTVPARAFSAAGSPVPLSSLSPIGQGLAHEHVVNAYWLRAPREHVLRELDRRLRAMKAMSRGDAENAANAEAVERFVSLVHSDGADALYAHYNLLSWGEREDAERIRGAAGAALSSCGLPSRLNTLDTPQLWIASLPGGEMEVGEDNLMLAETEGALCLGIVEGFTRDFPGGTLRLCDRRRRIPLRVDTQEAALRAGLIDNYNAFVLGPSGSGKSFFTNWYVRSCHGLGEEVFVIDRGGSYEGLAAAVREESGGRDGVLCTWSADSPYSFNPLEGCRAWPSEEEDGAGGLSFFTSLVKIIWSPRGGWDAASEAVLWSMAREFVAGWPEGSPDPLFDDFLAHVRDKVAPRVSGKGRRRPYLVGGAEVTPEVFDVRSFLVALDPYRRGGRFGFLLNAADPPDLFRSRLAVFEVDSLAEADPTLYALCVFCVIHAFERRMRSGDGTFRLLVIEEAWQAVATPGTAAYLKALWKTARKWHTSCMVVTQQVSDVVSSDLVRDAIIGNSPVKVLLDQRGGGAGLDGAMEALGLSPHEAALLEGVGRGVPEGGRWRELLLSLGGRRSGVYALEVSPEEALAYESDRARKRPLFERAESLGSFTAALRELAAQSAHPKDKENP